MDDFYRMMTGIIYKYPIAFKCIKSKFITKNKFRKKVLSKIINSKK